MTDAATEARAKLAEVIWAEVNRQCSIGAGECETDNETGLGTVSADLDLGSLADAILALPALSTPTPAGELREVVRREVIEECAKVADGLAQVSKNAAADASWSEYQRRQFDACVVPLQEAAKMIRALAQSGSGEGV